MNKAYVSEFTLFMEQFMHEHPEIVADQFQGWSIYWRLGDTL